MHPMLLNLPAGLPCLLARSARKQGFEPILVSIAKEPPTDAGRSTQQQTALD